MPIEQEVGKVGAGTQTDRAPQDAAQGEPASFVRIGKRHAARALLGHLGDSIGAVRALRMRHGPAVWFDYKRWGRMGTTRVAIFSDPVLAQRVLADGERFRNAGRPRRARNSPVQDRLRDHIFTLVGEEHKRVRRVIAAPLTLPEVRPEQSLVRRCVDERLSRWSVGDRLDMCREMRGLAQDIATIQMFGDEHAAELRDMIAEWTELSVGRPPRWTRHGSTDRRRGRMASRLDARVRELIRSRREQGLAGSDLVSRMLRTLDAHGGVGEDDMVAHIISITVAGHGTTSEMLTWTLFLLSQHPDVANRVREELSTQLDGEAPRVEQLDGLEELGRVVDESLRMFPLIALLPRLVLEDTEIGSLPMPRGSRVVVSAYDLHRDERTYPEPARFLPARWIDNPPPRGTYIPFGAGPHLCVGRFFAITVAKTTLAMILQRFTPRTVPGTRIDRRVELVLSPSRGMPMDLLGPEEAFERVHVRGQIREMVALG